MGAALQMDIHGEKSGSSKPKTPTEAPDSLRSVAMAKILIAMGEGEFAGNPTAQDIYLDNTPLQDPQGNMNFPNVKFEYRNGSIEQDYIQGIPSVENETTLGIELRSGTPWVRAITNTELSAVRLRFAWPMLQAVDASGNVNGYRIEYKVELSTDGGAYQQVLSEAVDGKTGSTYERTRRIDLPAAVSGWLIRVTRITPNQNNPNKIADTMNIAGFTEVIDVKLRYPNTALLYIEFSAEQFRNIPAVTVDTLLKKLPVPSNYNPETRSYTGIWDGTFKQAWSDNPAWMTYDITVSDRFGLGRRIKPWQVDKWELYRIAQYCDQLVPDGKGGQEPRFLCSLNLQGKADAWSLLRDISAIYRGMTYWAQGQVFSLSDMPRATDFDFAYTRANVIDGKFTYSSASERTRYSRALISYDNPANNYDTDVTAVTDPKLQRRYGDNPLEISAIGCTRESEAQRRGKWALLTNSRDRAITFRVGLDGRIPLPGYVIPVADELLAGRPIGGRISEVTGRTIKLDRDTQAKAGDRLILNLPNGTCEGRTVQSVSGRAITVTANYSVTPEVELVWALDADDLAVPLYRVTAVSRPEPGVFEISAVQYDPSKFAHIDTGARLEERPISVIPITVVPAPASVTLTSTSVVSQGLAVATMTINWPAVDGAVGYDVEWRKDSGNWIKLQRTGMTNVDVVGIYAGAYVARVRAVSAFDISSIWRNSILTNLSGKQGLPPALAYLKTISKVYGIGLEWGFPPGAEDTQRTEIWNNKVNDLATAVKLADFAYPQSNQEMQNVVPGTSLFFWGRLVDRIGNVGPWYPAVNGVNGQVSIDQSEYEKYFLGKIQESALGEKLFKEIGKISGDGEGSVNERLEQAKQELEDLIGEISDAMVYDPAKPYGKGEVVRLDGRLFSAIVAVPVGAAPPDPVFWYDMGTIAETSNAMALQIQKHTAQIDTIDGKVTAQASTMQALQAAWREDDGTGAMNEALKAYQSTASIVTNEKVIAEEKLASATRYTTLNAAVGKNAANLTSLEEVVATDKQATAQKIETLTATANDATAKAEFASTAVSGLNGKVSALTTIKTSTTVGGRTVMAGLAIGVEGETQESQILAFAQRFAILDEVSGQMIAPFVVQGGQVFMNTAIISQAFIKELVLGMTLRSAALNNQGLPLLEINIPAGTFTLRGQSDSGYTLLNNNGIYVYDLNYIERAALGKMT